MLILYLSALVFGLGLFAVQVSFSSSDGGGADHGADALANAPGAGELGSADAALVPSDGASAHGPGWASILLSLRFYMFAAIAFGVVGAPVSWLELASPLATFVASLLTGLSLGALAALGFRALERQTLSSGAHASELVGQLGRVLVACEKGRPGKVRLRLRGQTVDYLATTDEARLAPGTAVVVQELNGARVHVCAVPSELLPE